MDQTKQIPARYPFDKYQVSQLLDRASRIIADRQFFENKMLDGRLGSKRRNEIRGFAEKANVDANYLMALAMGWKS